MFAPSLGESAPSFDPSRQITPLDYPVSVKSVEEEDLAERTGLCARCQFMRQMKSNRGATFIRCELSATDASFPKYPRLPVLQCVGYQPIQEEIQRE